MAQEKLLTVRDVSLILGITEREVIDLAERGSIPAYKVGGVYLRFKPDQIEEFRKTFSPVEDKNKISSYSFKERLVDFLYFNDFYLFAFLIIILMLFLILRTF